MEIRGIEDEENSEEVMTDTLTRALKPILYSLVFYYASMKLAPRLVSAVSRLFGVEIDAEFK